MTRFALNDVLRDGPRLQNLKLRFWSKVQKCSLNDCWPWIPKATHPFGYGVINSGRGTTFHSHRVAYALTYGPIPHGAYVLHSCDNPECCNPQHLRLGTHQDNSTDAKWRKRLVGKTGPADTTKCARKLTADIAKQIKYSVLTNRALATQFGVSTVTVCSIRNGRSWPHV